MDISIKEIIKQRKSVRTFTGEKLKEEDVKSINEYISAVENPFGAAVTFRLLSAKEHGLSSPVIVGAENYIAAKVKKPLKIIFYFKHIYKSFNYFIFIIFYSILNSI